MLHRGSWIALVLVAVASMAGMNAYGAGDATAAGPVSLAGVWQAEAYPGMSGYYVTLFIGQDGSVQAEQWTYAGTVVWQFICDDQDHLWRTDLLDPAHPQMITLRESSHRFVPDASGNIAIDDYTMVIGQYSTIPVSGSGVLLDDDTMEVNLVPVPQLPETMVFVRQTGTINLAPYFDSVTVSGNLQPGQPGTVDLACRAYDLLGTVVSVSVDLTSLGGASNIPLTLGTEGLWKASGVTVVPPSFGRATVLFAAVDNDGAEGIVESSIMVGQASQAMLAGNWDRQDGSETIVLGATGNALSYFQVYGGNYAEIPCDGLPHQGLDGASVSIGSHTFSLDSQGGITLSEHMVSRYGNPKTVTGSGVLIDENTMQVTFMEDYGYGPQYETYVYTKVPFAPNQRPRIADVRLEGALYVATASQLSVSCVLENFTGTGLSVTVDLSGLGGSAAQALTLGGDGRWSWIGTVTPTANGWFDVQLTATNGQGATATASGEIRVQPALSINYFYYDSSDRDLRVGVPSEVTFYCYVTDTVGQVMSVVLDLSALGGSATQALESGALGAWSWTGTLTPPAEGTNSVTATATDDQGAVATLTQAYYVAGVVYLDPTVEGHLHVGQPGQLTISCAADSLAGPIVSVTADLSSLGLSSPQVLTPDGKGMWTWTGTVTPPYEGYWQISVQGSDDQGHTGSSGCSIRVNGKVHVGGTALSGTLMVDQTTTITLSCLVTELGLPVQQVVADLSGIGGPSDAELTQNGSQWTWTGTVTPYYSGHSWVYVRAYDTEGGWDEDVVMTKVRGAPWVGDVRVEGNLRATVPGQVKVSCWIDCSYGTITSVDADLSVLGGGMQPLTLGDDGFWSWTGTVTPPASGWQTVVVTATDDVGAVGTGYGGIWVNEAIQLTDVMFNGDLRVGLAGQATISCMTNDPSGTVVSITADLSELGLAGPQSLQQDADGRWTWIGTLTPPRSGNAVVQLTATDDQGTTSTSDWWWFVRGTVRIDSVQLSGLLKKDTTSTITLRCFVTEMGGPAQSVTTDLSSIGGPSEVAFVKTGSSWTWIGQVTPPYAGYQWAWVTVEDSDGPSDQYYMSPYVQDAIVIEDAAISGNLVAGQDCQVHVSGKITRQVDQIPWVCVDLYMIDGSYEAVAPAADGTFSLDTTVHPAAAGSFYVRVYCSDYSGNWTTLQLWVDVAGSSLPGDINGDGAVDAMDLLALANSFGKAIGQGGFDGRCDLNNDGGVDVVDLLILADNWPGGAPVVGDIDGDGVVDGADLSRLAASYNRTSGDPGFDPACDLNNDGSVNVVDLLILGDNWTE